MLCYSSNISAYFTKLFFCKNIVSKLLASPIWTGATASQLTPICLLLLSCILHKAQIQAWQGTRLLKIFLWFSMALVLKIRILSRVKKAQNPPAPKCITRLPLIFPFPLFPMLQSLRLGIQQISVE